MQNNELRTHFFPTSENITTYSSKMIQQSPTKQSMASSMLITRPRSSSSSDGSTTSVVAAGSKKEDDALLARVLVRSRARPPAPAHGLPSEYRRPLKKARSNHTGVSEKHAIFLQDKEDHHDKDGIQSVVHRGSLSSISSTLSGTTTSRGPPSAPACSV